MTEKTKQNIKRWTISSLVTFFTGVSIVLVGDIDNITIESIKSGSVTGLLFIAFRSGIKGILELYLSKFGKKQANL